MTARPSLLVERLEVVAATAVADVELVTDDGEPHGVSAEQKLAVLNGV